ncbi:MAG: hypothetical protein BECKG1743D_GA0114223_104112 [Candidatus Kentron sp. G]|nr:MAG: hypothetical protein BECKG1743F_GA0114225_102692 [Candidatus Kentron sp. G]VFN00798.1 MAG: hypothetical protein BECKG1743E_GA0114224_103523 [Candidatus Kentron sp. G]VFN02918.1 MAG: hypothetical protein BECKG1743D_GA0114223_104112 [Candidatus Kentron sp. G]
MNIDAVAMMREIRGDLDRKMQGMTWEEKRAFIRDSIKSFDFITKGADEDSLGGSEKESSRSIETHPSTATRAGSPRCRILPGR